MNRFALTLRFTATSCSHGFSTKAQPQLIYRVGKYSQYDPHVLSLSDMVEFGKRFGDFYCVYLFFMDVKI